MQSNIDGRSLAKATKAVASIAGAGSYMPVLNQARIDTESGRLRITGTNLETWIHYTVDCSTAVLHDGAPLFIDAGRLCLSISRLLG